MIPPKSSGFKALLADFAAGIFFIFIMCSLKCIFFIRDIFKGDKH